MKVFELSIIFIRTKAGSNHCVFTPETCSDANLWPSYGEDKGKAQGKPTRGQEVSDLLCLSSMPAVLKAHKYSLVRATSHIELWPKLNPTDFPEVQMPSLRSISCESIDWQGSDPDWSNSYVIQGKNVQILVCPEECFSLHDRFRTVHSTLPCSLKCLVLVWFYLKKLQTLINILLSYTVKLPKQGSGGERSINRFISQLSMIQDIITVQKRLICTKSDYMFQVTKPETNNS